MKICEGCGNGFIRHGKAKTCNEACAKAAVKRRRQEAARLTKDSQVQTCEQCKAVFVGHKRRFCTRRCGERSKQLRCRFPAICKHCGKGYLAWHKQQAHCSRRCAKGGRDAICEWCQKTFPARQAGRRKNRFCSRACVQAAWAKRDGSKGYDKAKAVARVYARRALSKQSGEVFKAEDVFARDEYQCGICGLPTDRTKGWPHPDAPTVDHIIPVSKGGTHTMANVQCSHWSCNLGKRDSLTPSDATCATVATCNT